MAQEAVAEAVSDAVLDLLRQAIADAPSHVERAIEWLRDNAQPEAGVKLVSPDGSLYTGVAVIDRNDVVVLVAARQPGLLQAPRPAAVPLGSPPYTSGRRLFDEEENVDGWPPDPYRR